MPPPLLTKTSYIFFVLLTSAVAFTFFSSFSFFPVMQQRIGISSDLRAKDSPIYFKDTDLDADWKNFWPPAYGGEPPPVDWRSMPWLTGTPGLPSAWPGRLYPLTFAMFQRSFSQANSTWQRSAWARIRANLNAGEHVHIATIGGSFTADTCQMPLCSWPNYLLEWLHRVKPRWHITLHNIARSGATSNDFANSEFEHADIYIVDTALNDVWNTQLLRNLLLRFKTILTSNNNKTFPPAVLYAHPYSVGGPSCREDCLAEHLRTWKNESYCWCPSQWSGYDHLATEARSFGVPVASYRDAVWPDAHNPPPDFPLFWNGTDLPQHPYSVTHHMYSDVVKYALSRLLFHDPEQPSNATNEGLLADYGAGNESSRICALRQGSVRMGFDNPASFKHIGIEGNWTFSADRPGKVGWIARPPPMVNRVLSDVLPSLSIHFPVTFSGQFPRLEITFMRSYDSFLDASVFLSCCIHGLIDDLTQHEEKDPALRGWWSSKWSLSDTVTWQTQAVGAWKADKHGSFSERLFSQECSCVSGTQHTLTIRVLAPPVREPNHDTTDWHFKLLAITTC
jgi:hypothetical protein